MASTYTVERTRTIPTPIDRVHPLISDFRQWTRWSPWEEVDPDLHRAYTGPETGVGSVYAWSGNRKAGAGRMEILADEPERVQIALHFDKPFKSDNDLTFLLTPEGEQTAVTWRMTGTKPLLMRVAGPLMNMDKLVGKDFDRGLDKMALVAPAG